MPNPADLETEPARDHGSEPDRRERHERAQDAALDFRAVFDFAPDVYLVLAPDPPRFTILAANDARLRATGTSGEDVIGTPLFEAFPDNPADSAATGVRNLRASLLEVIRTGEPQRMALQKYDLRGPTGVFEERWWEPLNSPVFDEDGKLAHIIHRVEDVTEQVRAERELAEATTARREGEALLKKLGESETRYRLLADMIPQSVWITDGQGYHGYFSKRWYDWTGATLDDTEGTGWMKYLHPDDRERTAARWEHSLRTGERYSVEYRFRQRDGTYRWYWGQAAPLRNDAGEIVQWFGTLTDISERKQHDEERERLLAREREARAEAERRREALERVTESRTRLMRGFSHDVKNPLGAADGFAALLEEGIGGALSEGQLKSVRRIRRSISTSLRLIHDLLELARAEAGQIDIACVTTDVAAAAREVADDFQAQAAGAGLELKCHAGAKVLAETDPTRVRQILANLLSNAVKYAPNGTLTLEAGLRDSGGPRAGSWVTASVADTGPGIPEDKRERIFQEFTRLDPSAQPGAGVGLAISRRIAQLLGGDLTVESEVGRGSTFTLWLPPASSAGTSSVGGHAD